MVSNFVKEQIEKPLPEPAFEQRAPKGLTKLWRTCGMLVPGAKQRIAQGRE